MNENKNLDNYPEVDFAVEYSKAERITMVKKYLLIGAIVFAFMQLLFIPLLAKFASNAHNINIFGISGTTILLVGIFLGMPILAGILLSYLFKIAIKTIKEKQYPPKEFKVFRKTKIIKGRKAIAKAVIILLLYFVAIIPVTIFGYSSLNIMLNNRSIDK